MKLRAAISFLLLIVSFKVQALSVLVGHKLFHAPEGDVLSPYTELYWEIDASTVSFQNTLNSWSANIQVEVTLSNDTGVFLQDNFLVETPAAVSREVAIRQTILNIRRYRLSNGKVKLQLTCTDLLKPANKFSFTDTFTVAVQESAFMSGLQLLDTAYRSKVESPFQRNGMQHIPLSVPFLDDFRNALNYYFEVYGLDKLPKEEFFVMKVFISKKLNENALVRFIRTDTIKAGHIVPVYGSFPIQGLASGNYYLNASVYDGKNKKVANSAVFFQRVANKEILEKITDSLATKVTDTIAQKDLATFDISKTFIAKYKPEQVKAILKMLLPIADASETQNINGFISRPDDMYSRYFIYNFFLNRNTSKPDKEWEAYADKVREVNKMFAGGIGPAYESDRGYVYLKYGKPNERVIVESEEGALPYEIWQYFSVKTQGQDGVFLFYRPGNMVNDYKLLHTTVTTEVKNQNWRLTLYPNGKTGMRESQAELYLRNR